VPVHEGSNPNIVLEAPAEATIHVSSGTDESIPRALVVFAKGEALVGPVEATRQGNILAFEHMPLGQYTVVVGADPEEPVSSSDVRLTRDGEVVAVQISLPESHPISGRVIDEHGTAVVEAWVRVENPPGSVVASVAIADPVLTNDRGEFMIGGVLRGRYDLVTTSARGEAVTQGIQAGAQDVLVRLESFGALSGVVQDWHGRPVPQFRVTLAHENGIARSLSGTEGTWSSPWLAAGTYRLSVSSDLGIATREAVVLLPGAALDVSMRVRQESDERQAIPAEPAGLL
jgi:hypothetical protein